MSEIERLLHNFASAVANIATAHGMQVTAAEKQRDAAVAELAAYIEKSKAQGEARKWQRTPEHFGKKRLTR